MNKISWHYTLALALVIVGSSVILFFVFLSPAFNDYSSINSDLASSFGDFIGGLVGPIFSLAGVFLLFDTLAHQRLTFQRQQFESKFFELLKIYRDNVNEMSYTQPQTTDELRGREVFVEIRKQFGEFYEEVSSFITTNCPSLDDRDKVNIAYLAVFLGVSNTSSSVLKHYLDRNYPAAKKQMNLLIYQLGRSHPQHDGFQSQLGHYFRHLFQTVKFADKETSLSKKEKYFYVKTLRAQLSTFELAVFFFNAISDFGQAWSVEKVNLIQEYHFIKNIPANFTFHVDPKQYYPDVKYEFDEINVASS